jgi:hypothetical protein
MVICREKDWIGFGLIKKRSKNLTAPDQRDHQKVIYNHEKGEVATYGAEFSDETRGGGDVSFAVYTFICIISF